MSFRLSMVLGLLALLFAAPAAQAAGSPNIGLTADPPARVLFGKPATVTLTAANPSGQPHGYNLTFRDVLPAGIGFVDGSATYAGAPVTPQKIVAGDGTTTLVWSNVGDLSPNSSGALRYQVTHATAGPDAYSISGARSSYAHSASAYVNTNPRTLPAFSATGAYASGATGSDAKTATTNITAVEITVGEDSPEGELLRGAHDHQTVYRLRLDNNAVAATGPLTVETFLPAGLEFLGCGQDDHTTDAPTDPGSAQEWPGSGPLSGNVAAPVDCVAPNEVQTVSLDPDGAGSLPSGVYTRVRWTGLAALAAAGTRDLRYVAAVPLRANTTSWSAATPTAGSLQQGSNLDNNNGARTQDEQGLPTYATVGGNYNLVTPVSDDDALTRTAEDIRILKAADTGAITDAQVTRWTLTLATGEYRYVDDIRVTDTVPDGLCPLDAVNRESDQTADCAPAPGGLAPSAPYAGIAENANGSWTLAWDSSSDAALTRMQPSDVHQIAFSTRSRPYYQENSGDTRPVLARDAWTNTVGLLGKDYQRCVAPADCGVMGAKIDTVAGLPAETDIEGSDDVDASSASQAAGSPSIDKTIRDPAVTPVDCATGVYTDARTGPYGPGDRICFTLRVNFPALLDTGRPTVTDFLPTGTGYESYVTTPDNTVNIKSVAGAVDDPVVTWTLGAGATDDAANGQVFEVLVSAIVRDPNGGRSDDVKGNLMKFSHANSDGVSFPLRDQVEFTWEEAELSLTEGVRDINDGAANGANVDDGTVQAGDVVTVRVDVANGGDRDAIDAEIWERLPLAPGSPTVDCAVVTSISDGGLCANGVIVWDLIDVPAGGARTLTYDYPVPAGVRPSTRFNHLAGVRTYESADNLGGTFRYYPAQNIDPLVVSGALVNTARADDPTHVDTATPLATLTRTTAVNSGPAGNVTSQATIGERISYTSTLTIPQGTTLSGGASTYTLPLGTRQTYVPGVTADLNGGALPGGVTIGYDAGAAAIVLTFPDGYTNATGSGGDVFTIHFDATVDEEAQNTRVATGTTTDVVQQGTFAYRDSTNAARTISPTEVATQLVEPVITLGKDENDADDRVAPGQVVRYTLTLGNGAAASRVSAANDTTIVDTLPAGVTPVAVDGTLDDGDAVTPDNGVWNAAARTLTFTHAALNPGGSATFRYDVRVDDPQSGNAVKVNNAVAFTSSYAAAAPAPGTERAGTLAAAPASPAGYRLTATDTVRLIGAALTKSVDASTATVGERRAYTLDVTLPPGLDFHDVTVRDLLADGLDYEPGSFAFECVGGCGLTASAIAPTANGDGSTQLGFFLGDIASSLTQRVVRITYAAHVDDTYQPENTPVRRGDALPNTAAVHSNQTDVLGTPATVPAPGAFTDAGPNQVRTITVTEPTLTIDKDVSGQAGDSDVRDAQPGDTLTYSLTVTNTGNDGAHDIVVDDAPDAELGNVVAGAPPAGVALVDGWSAGDRDLRWTIASLPAGQSLTLTYTAQLAASATLAEAAAAVNTADVTEYFGRSLAYRQANPGADYRDYDDVTPDSVTVNVDLPRVEVDLTTAAAGFPESENAEVGQDFPWRAVVRNTSPSATAHDVDLTVRLPRNWTYTAGSSAGGGGEPAITPDPAGDLLTWANVTDLGPGASRTVTFAARPTRDATADAGTGAGNPHVAQARVSADDGSGASASADGPYADGPDPAQAILRVPSLVVAKTPDALTADAGTVQSYSIVVTNTGPVRARHIVVADTLPAGVSYAAGAATSAAAGFAETDGAGPGLAWTADGLNAGQSLTITLPVRIAASLDAGTALVNTAAASSDERPDVATDTGTITTDTHVDLELAKSGPVAAKAGEVITWTLEATNHGPSDARDAQIVDTLPADVTFVDAAPGCAHVAGTVTCALGTLTPGQQVSRTVRTRIVPGTLAPAILNHAELESSVDELDVSDNVAEATVVTDNAVDLELTKTAATPTVVQTLNGTWKLRVVNKGPSDAYDVELVDTLPAGVTFVSATPDQGTCAVAGAVITCELGRIDEGKDADVTVVARGDVVGPRANTAEVGTSLNTEIDPADNVAAAAITVLPAADLAIAKQGPAEAPAGGRATYTLTARNDGPSAATAVAIVDELPAGVTLESASDGCAAAGQTVTCAVGALAVGERAERTLTVRMGAELASQVVQNVGRVSAAEADLELTDNTALADTRVGPAADLRIVKRSTKLYASGDVTYLLDVFNDGPSDAAQVTVADTLPAGLRFRGAVSTQGTCAAAGQDVRCALGDIPDGGAAAIQITATAGALPAGATVENAATVSGAVLDPTPENNTARVSGVVAAGVAPRHDLALVKTASVVEPRLGERFTYTLSVRNNGPDTARNVTLTDPVPAGLEIGSVTPKQGACQADRQLLRCALGSLAPGARTTVSITATSVRIGRFVNNALVAADGTDTKESNNADVAGVRVVSAGARIGVTKRAARRALRGGATMRYVIAVRARGGAARDVRVCDRLPDGMVFATARGARFSAGHACWTVRLLRKGAVRRFRLTALAEVGARGQLVNRAIATAPGARRKTARATVVARPDQGTRGGGVTG